MSSLAELEDELSIDMKLEQLLLLVCNLLSDLAEEDPSPCESIFNSPSAPTISLHSYLSRLHKYTQFSPACLLLAVIYVDRYNLQEQTFSLSNLNVHKIMLAALVLATKFHDDFYYQNKAFEFAGGVGVNKIGQMEVELFSKLGFAAFVSQQEYQQLESKLYQVYGESEQE